MKKRQVFFVLIILIFLGSQSGLLAQTSSSASMGSTNFDMSDFPLWAKDLRRGEIIAFGSFPFTYFLMNFGFDLYRWGTNGWDRRYAPSLFSSAGAIEKTQTQKFITIGLSAGGAIIVAAVDYGIMRHKRKVRENEIKSLPEGTPVIIRTPLYGDHDTDALKE